MKNTRGILIISLFVVVLFTQGGLARIITVAEDKGGQFDTIQEAINVASFFDTIVVQPGTYAERINFQGKMITVRCSDPNNQDIISNTIIDGGGSGDVVSFKTAEGQYSQLIGFSIINGETGIKLNGTTVEPMIVKCIIASHKYGIVCDSGAKPKISNCVIEDNTQYGLYRGGGRIFNSKIRHNRANIQEYWGRIENCVISGAYWGSGIWYTQCNLGDIINCTIIGNKDNGIGYSGTCNGTGRVVNCIIAMNGDYGIRVSRENTKVTLQYNCIYGNDNGPSLGITAGPHDFFENPLFINSGYRGDNGWHEGDYHLASTKGTWNANSQSWIEYPIDSPCLDRGDPNESYGFEPYPNGGRINMGAYGNTNQASMSDGPSPYCVKYPDMDFNKDCKVDQLDLDIFMQQWLSCGLDPESTCDFVTDSE